MIFYVVPFWTAPSSALPSPVSLYFATPTLWAGSTVEIPSHGLVHKPLTSFCISNPYMGLYIQVASLFVSSSCLYLSNLKLGNPIPDFSVPPAFSNTKGFHRFLGIQPRVG